MNPVCTCAHMYISMYTYAFAHIYIFKGIGWI